MYLKKIWITILKVKNVLLLIVSLFLLFLGVADLVSLYVYYEGDMFTINHAVSTPESIAFIIIGILSLIFEILSNKAMMRAGFYSSYFESSLYSDISCEELSEITGYSGNFIRFDLPILRFLYMKKFYIRKNENGNYIELYSKKIRCSCKNCGANIDKKEYFAGICPYCKTSDVFATVLTDNKVYSIRNEFSKKRLVEKDYVCKFHTLRIIAFSTSFVLSSTICFILTAFDIDYLSKYNDKEYLKDVLLSGSSYSSYELIQKSMMSTIIWAGFFAIIMIPIIILSFRRLLMLVFARRISETLACSKSPYVNLSALNTKKSKGIRTIRKLRRLLQARYLRNCTIEKQDKFYKIALARKIVKDECPTCGASIVGAVDDSYVCQYCKNRIMNVMIKK